MIGFILADLRRLWAGSLVVLLLVALATALGMAVTLEERALRLGSARAADAFDLVVGAPGSETQLVLSSVFLQPAPLPLMPGEVLSRLSADRRVEYAVPIGFGDFAGTFPIVGTTAIAATDNGRRPLAEGRAFARLGEAVVGAATNLPLGATIRPMHGLAAEGGHVHGGIAYTVVGRMARSGSPWDRAVLVPIEAVWRVHGMVAEDRHADPAPVDAGALPGGIDARARDGHGLADVVQAGDEPEGHFDPAEPIAALPAAPPGLPSILVKPKTIADAYRLRQDYRKSGETLAVFPGEVLTRLYGTLGDARTVLSAVASGAQLLVAAAIGLVTVVHVTQRRRQIGALRAFGAPRPAIFAIVWIELFALVGLGVLTGLGIGFAAALSLSKVLSTGTGIDMPVEFARSDAGLVLALLAGAAVLATIPAVLAYRQPAAAALRA